MTYPTGDLSRFTGATVPDFVPRDLRLLIGGINPGLVTAATGVHFGKRGNRFYPALVAAGILPRVPVLDGTADDARALLDAAGIGVTNLVPVATAGEDELTLDQKRAGALALEQTVRRLRPPVVALLGLGAYRAALGLPRDAAGELPDGFAGARAWLLPNPSGRSSIRLETLAAVYAEPARAAGLID